MSPPVLSSTSVAAPALPGRADLGTCADLVPLHCRWQLAALANSERGMTTAEYAVGTVAACGFGGVLYKIVTSDVVAQLVTDIIQRALTLSF